VVVSLSLVWVANLAESTFIFQDMGQFDDNCLWEREVWATQHENNDNKNIVLNSRSVIFKSYIIKSKHCKNLYVNSTRRYKTTSRDSSVGIATGYGLDDRGVSVSSPRKVKNFLFCTSSRPALGST
jgi:hypothetical protein